MTTGEKIAQLRRLKGISQEELAEKLGISRQAVSKWEAGTATPSTDNFKELSRLFGVSVDELLYPDDIEVKADVETSNEAKPSSKKEDSRPVGFWKRYKAAIIGACGCAAAVWLIVLQIQLFSLGRELDRVREIAQNAGGVVTIPQYIPTQDSQLTDWNVSVSDYDPQQGQITLEFQATPETYSENTQASFSMKDKTGSIACEAILENGSFYAQASLQIDDLQEPDLYLMLTEGGEVKNIYVQSLQEMFTYFRLQCDGHLEHMNRTGQRWEATVGVMVVNQSFYNSMFDSELEKWRAYPVSGSVTLYADGKEISRQQLDFGNDKTDGSDQAADLNAAQEAAGEAVYFTHFSGELEENPSEVWFEYEVVDNFKHSYTGRIDTSWAG